MNKCRTTTWDDQIRPRGPYVYSNATATSRTPYANAQSTFDVSMATDPYNGGHTQGGNGKDFCIDDEMFPEVFPIVNYFLQTREIKGYEDVIDCDTLMKILVHTDFYQLPLLHNIAVNCLLNQ